LLFQGSLFLPFYESLVLPPLKRKYRGLNFNQFGSTNFPSLAFVTVIYFLSECRIKLCSLVSSFFFILTTFKLPIKRFVETFLTAFLIFS
jgi:hypothetical protein